MRGRIEEIKFFEPCVGSGHILSYAFDVFYRIYEEEGYNPTEIPELIITKNLFGVDIDEKQQEVQRKFNSIIGDLPKDVKTPNISKVIPSDQPILQLQATSNISSGDFYDLIKLEILPQIQQVTGWPVETVASPVQRVSTAF